jgi:hypothetical protein
MIASGKYTLDDVRSKCGVLSAEASVEVFKGGKGAKTNKQFSPVLWDTSAAKGAPCCPLDQSKVQSAQSFFK